MPGLEILVSIGRLHCDKVGRGLTAQLLQGKVSHFMIIQTMGTLATANISGIMTFLKPALINILPTLCMIKQDHVKQAYAFALGQFAEAITEFSALESAEKVDSSGSYEPSDDFNFESEMGIAYDVLLHQWMPSREPMVSSVILQSLSHIYPLLPRDTILEQLSKVIPQLLGYYRRSMDRNTITQLLASVVKTTIHTKTDALDIMSDVLIASLFDLVCVNPDYAKPQTTKGHNEVLRCFDLMLEIYSSKVFEMLLVQMRSNNERERIKSLLLLSHLTNAYDHLIAPRIMDFVTILQHMIVAEKTIKVKMVLLKTIVALGQKALIADRECIKFIIKHSCQPSKVNHEHGTAEEQSELLQACSTSLYILSTTVGTMDELLKRELLHAYLQLNYTSITNNIAKCLTKLFSKQINSPTTPEVPSAPATPDHVPESSTPTTGEDEFQETSVPTPESVFIRSLILMGNPMEGERRENILHFLNVYCPVLNKHLKPLWLQQISPLLLLKNNNDDLMEKLYQFLQLTIKDVDDHKFAESIVNKIVDQLSLYPMVLPLNELMIPNLQTERGMLLKILGVSLCYIADPLTIESKIDLIINTSRQEKIDKNTPNSEYESRLQDGAEALGFASKTHLEIVLQKLEALLQDGNTKKGSGNFFSGLNFIKDSNKEADLYKITVLSIEAYQFIVQKAPASLILNNIDGKCVHYLHKQLSEVKDFTLKRLILNTLLTIAQQILKSTDVDCELATRSNLLGQLYKMESTTENLSLFPLVLKLATALIRCNAKESAATNANEIHEFFEESCRKFFTNAEQLKTKFDSVEDDEKNSFLAKYLNLSLPELNLLVKAIFELNASPATLDDVISVLEFWIRNRNSEVRICAGHVMNHALGVSEMCAAFF